MFLSTVSKMLLIHTYIICSRRATTQYRRADTNFIIDMVLCLLRFILLLNLPIHSTTKKCGTQGKILGFHTFWLPQLKPENKPKEPK